MIHNSLHQWVNKVAGVEVPYNKFFEEGKEGHKIIQAHVSGKKKDPRLSYLEIEFPIVEEKDFDDRLRWKKEMMIEKENYLVQGFADGLDKMKNPTTMLEIKLSSSPWSAGKFQRSMQRKLYAWGFPTLEKAFLITGSRDPKKWEKEPLQLIEVEMNEKDKKEAKEWVDKAIERLHHLDEILSSRDKTTGLDENGKCNDYNCIYKENCLFK